MAGPSGKSCLGCLLHSLGACEDVGKHAYELQRQGVLGTQRVAGAREERGRAHHMIYAGVVTVFALLVAIVALASLATRLRVPYAILLVLGGLVLGFVPGLPPVTLDPALVLFLFLPPLIYSSAWFTPWRDFRA